MCYVPRGVVDFERSSGCSRLDFSFFFQRELFFVVLVGWCEQGLCCLCGQQRLGDISPTTVAESHPTRPRTGNTLHHINMPSELTVSQCRSEGEQSDGLWHLSLELNRLAAWRTTAS